MVHVGPVPQRRGVPAPTGFSESAYSRFEYKYGDTRGLSPTSCTPVTRGKVPGEVPTESPFLDSLAGTSWNVPDGALRTRGPKEEVDEDVETPVDNPEFLRREVPQGEVGRFYVVCYPFSRGSRTHILREISKCVHNYSESTLRLFTFLQNL